MLMPAGCENEKTTVVVETEIQGLQFIDTYHDTELLPEVAIQNGGQIVISVCRGTDWASYTWNAESTAAIRHFYDLAVKHKDFGCTAKIRAQLDDYLPLPENEVFLALDFAGVGIVSDADWDETHPAGASLADLFNYRTNTYYPFIRQGYQPFRGSLVRNLSNPLTAFQKEDFRCLRGGTFMSFYTTQRPTADATHRFTVTLTTDEGQEIVLTTQAIDCTK